jgi:hypothetical protein
MTIYTTLNKIRACKPCGIKEDDTTGFRKLLNFLGKTTSDDEPLKFSTILESSGIIDALWCLRSICPEYNREVRLFAADCAERVLPIWEEWAKIHVLEHFEFPRKAIEATRDYSEGSISKKELNAAYAAADAAYDAADERKAQGELLIKYFG